MANLKDKQSQLHSMLPVVRVGPGLQTSVPPNVESSLMEFARAWEFLEPAVAISGEQTMASVLAALANKICRLWVSDTSAVIGEIVRYPSGLTVGNGWLTGGDLKEIVSWIPMLEAWAKANGATKTRVIGRRGWVRAAPGYKEFRTVVMKDLV